MCGTAVPSRDAATDIIGERVNSRVSVAGHRNVDATLDHRLIARQIVREHLLTLNFCICVTDTYIFDVTITDGVDAPGIEALMLCDRLATVHVRHTLDNNEKRNRDGDPPAATLRIDRRDFIIERGIVETHVTHRSTPFWFINRKMPPTKTIKMTMVANIRGGSHDINAGTIMYAAVKP